MKQVVVLIDPEHEYGAAFIEIVSQVWGLQTVCLYTNRRSAYLYSYQYPVLASDKVVGNFLIEGMSIDQVAHLLAQKFNVAAVIPHVETSVVSASELAAALGLDWGQPEVVARFRDKYALKTYLRSRPNGPRTNHVAIVGSVADIRGQLSVIASDRIVLKPNDGFGNTDVGFFSRDSTDRELGDFLDRASGDQLLLEEFISGDEYYVNGQVDGAGLVTVLMICRSQRISANGKPNVLDEAIKVDRSEPVFALLADYVVSVVAQSGLLRSPFHAEVIVDQAGPCLVEIGARLCGAQGAIDINIAHGGQINMFQIAAHYYLSAEPFQNMNLDWQHYDSTAYTTVYGTSYQTGRIGRLTGIAEVEAMPEFVRWIHKPVVGEPMVPTTDMFNIAYLLNLQASTADQLQAAVARVRRTLVFNDGELAEPDFGLRVRAVAGLAGRAAHALPRVWMVRPASLAREVNRRG